MKKRSPSLRQNWKSSGKSVRSIPYACTAARSQNTITATCGTGMITTRMESPGRLFYPLNRIMMALHYLTDTGRTWSGKQSLRDVMRTHPGIDDPLVS